MAVRTATAELTARERSEPRWSVRRVIPAFVWLWVVTRLLLLVISLNPRLYSSGVYGDVRAYGAKVERMFQGELPYRDVAIEYPPGSVPFTLMPLLVLRFDLIPAVCVLLAAALAAEGRAGPSAAALGYGAAAKLFPAVLAPLLVLGLVPAEGWRRSLRRTVPPFLVTFAVTLVPALIISASGTVGSLLYHIRRGVQIESLPANLI